MTRQPDGYGRLRWVGVHYLPTMVTALTRENLHIWPLQSDSGVTLDHVRPGDPGAKTALYLSA